MIHWIMALVIWGALFTAAALVCALALAPVILIGSAVILFFRGLGTLLFGRWHHTDDDDVNELIRELVEARAKETN